MAQFQQSNVTNPAEVKNLWLRLTSYRGTGEPPTVEKREHIRRSGVMSWILLGMLVAAVVLLPLGLKDTPTLEAVVAAIVIFLIAAVFNRAGQTVLAGVLVIIALDGGALFAAVTQTGGLSVDSLPVYDLLAVTVIIGATALPRSSAFAIAAFNSALIVADFTLQPHASDLVADINYYGAPPAGAIALLVRPIALEVIVAVVTYLWVRSTDNAIRRADRAEEIAGLEHSLAEQKRQLDVGINQILQTHVRVANGDFNARTPLGQDNVLWQIGASLNNLLARIQRASQAEFMLQRTQEEINHMVAALDDLQAGRRPIWPAPTGTPADPLLEHLVHAFHATGGAPRAPHSQPQSHPHGQQLPPNFSQFGQPAGPTGGQPFEPGAFPGAHPGAGMPAPQSAPASAPNPFAGQGPFGGQAPQSGQGFPVGMPTTRAPYNGPAFPLPDMPNQGNGAAASQSNPWAFPLDDEEHPQR